MKQEQILLHFSGQHDHKQCVTELTALSNENGIFAYFTNEDFPSDLQIVLNCTIERLELLLDKIEIDERDETSYNELNKLRIL